MTNFEEEILNYVRQHPGCHRTDLIAELEHINAGNEADHMVWGGKLNRWYTGQVPAYYIPGTYTPPEMRELLPLAAGLHKDKSIHIYVNEDDSGLSVGLLEDGTLCVKVAGSKRTMVAGKA